MVTTGGRPSAPLEAEERVGPYRLVRRLGQGGMGVVYLAQAADERDVALKVLRSHVAHDSTARARLERETATLQKVDHPGVAGLLDFDLQGERPYLVTRYVPGKSLDEHVEDRGPLTPQRWLPLAGCLAEALQAIHRAGVVHRDLKPGNVLMLNGRPIVIDFGIAQAADDLRLTATGLVIGTPGYLSPELIDGEAVTESADWWGWAATCAFAATGRRPFGKGPFEVVLHRVHTGQFDLEGVDPRLQPLLAAALSPNKRERPTAEEIMTGLSRYSEGRDALVPNTKTVTTEVEAPPSTRVMSTTRVMPTDDAATEITPAITDEPAQEPDKLDPAEVAKLVPSVIPPLSAFEPLRARIRATTTPTPPPPLASAAGQPVPGQPFMGQPLMGQPVPGQGMPSHPATYSPAPTSAQPASLPLAYQSPAYSPAQPTNYPPQGHTSNYPAPGQAVSPYGQPAPMTKKEKALARRQQAAPPVPPHLLPTRSGLLFAILMALVGLAAILPVVAFVVLAVLMVIARLVDRSSTALLRRREVRGGRGRSDGLVAVAASPVHLVTAATITLPCLILPLFVGFTVGGLATLVAAVFQGLSWGHLATTGVAIGALSGFFTAWVGPGGTSMRRGARAALRSAFRPAWLSTLVAVLLLGAAALCWLNVAGGSTPDWSPIGTPSVTVPERPSLGDVRELPGIRDIPFIGR
ncbi:protein kinase [Kribbella sp. NBC_01245]|uniref:protein kinase domain-containing protein n=1 Tax=Kribbella sp. NBC_01245 TaxID=2903578 RepID=UPI002E2CC972|nr:protein kinase [Kribbella sp. NBC_01245]